MSFHRGQDPNGALPFADQGHDAWTSALWYSVPNTEKNSEHPKGSQSNTVPDHCLNNPKYYLNIA